MLRVHERGLPPGCSNECITAAYKYADGKRIDDRRVVVDVERGRTVKGWKPRRLGGGRGGRKTGATDPATPAGGASRRPSMENDRPPGGGPMRFDRDRNNNRDMARPPYGERPPFENRGPPAGGFQERGRFERNGDRGPMRDDRAFTRER